MKSLGSARVSRVGFGVSPKQSTQKSPRKRDASANTRDACATRNERAPRTTSCGAQSEFV